MALKEQSVNYARTQPMPSKKLLEYHFFIRETLGDKKIEHLEPPKGDAQKPYPNKRHPDCRDERPTEAGGEVVQPMDRVSARFGM